MVGGDSEESNPFTHAKLRKKTQKKTNELQKHSIDPYLFMSMLTALIVSLNFTNFQKAFPNPEINRESTHSVKIVGDRYITQIEHKLCARPLKQRRSFFHSD